MRNSTAAKVIDMYDNKILLSVIRAMAEDLLRYQPTEGCPTHGHQFMRRDKNGERRCWAIGCNYHRRLERSLSQLIDRYLEQADAY